jgi:hypothetical protein
MGPITNVAFDPFDDRGIYAAVAWYGVLSSSDGGLTWQTRLRDDTCDIASTPSRFGTLYVAGWDGVRLQRSFIRWPWIGEWEPKSNGLGDFYAMLRDRTANLVSWLVVLTVIIALIRGYLPTKLSGFIQKGTSKYILAVWTVIPSLLIGTAYWETTNHVFVWNDVLASAIIAVPLFFLLLIIPMSWMVLGMTLLPQILSIGYLIFSNWTSFKIDEGSIVLLSMLAVWCLCVLVSFVGQWYHKRTLTRVMLLTTTAISYFPLFLLFCFSFFFFIGV